MENCCYGRRELMALNMKEQGVFGDIVHCRGGYMHDLRSEVTRGKKTAITVSEIISTGMRRTIRLTNSVRSRGSLISTTETGCSL